MTPSFRRSSLERDRVWSAVSERGREEVIPVADQARSGPLVVVSPSNTQVGLTRSVGGEAMISVPGVDPQALAGPGRRLIEGLREAIGEPHPYTFSAARATQLLLDAIGRSDGTRRSVISELFASDVRGGVLGNFSVTPTGDTTADRVTIYRIEDGERRLHGVLTPPLSLVAPG